MKKLVIKEVDCYVGNKFNMPQYATEKATQHQFLVVDGDRCLPIGRLNGVSDSDRGERIVSETKMTNKAFDLWMEAIELKKKFANEYCDTAEEYKKAVEFNQPLRNELNGIMKKLHDELKLNVSLEDFVKFSIY